MGWAIASTPPLKSFAVECTVYNVYVYTSIVETVDESEGVVEWWWWWWKKEAAVGREVKGPV